MLRMFLIAEVEIDEKDPHVGKWIDPFSTTAKNHEAVGDVVRRDVAALLRDVGYFARVEVVYLPEMLKP